MPDSDPFVNSLVSKTAPDPYQQIIFLSQKTINQAFRNMWELADPSSPIRTVNVRDRAGNTLNARLKAPTVLINVADNNNFMAYMQWNFDQGQMNLFTSSNPGDPTMKTFDVANWVYAFGSDIARQVLTDNNLIKFYAEQMGVPLPPSAGGTGIYSIAQLFMQLEENPTYYPQGSNFQGEDWSKETTATQANMATLLYAWMTQMVQNGQTNIGVVLQTDKPETVNAQAPTFPPKQIDHSVYPWIDPVNPLPVSNDTDANALCYLVTTINHSPPVPAKINYTGTWVTTQPLDPNRGAIMCINRAQFWEEWLLPLLQVINLGTQIQGASIYLVPYESNSCKAAPHFAAGTCYAHPDFTDAYYKFVPAGDGKSWTWKADSALLSNTKSITNGGTTWTVTQISTAETKVTFGGGDRIFNITGKNSVQILCPSSGAGWDSDSHEWVDVDSDMGNLSPNASMSFDMGFSLDYAVTRVDTGALQIMSAGNGMQITPSSVAYYTSDNVTWTPPWDAYGDWLQNRVATAFTSYLTAYKAEFLSALSGQHKLILPGAGDYLCNQVMFSAAGDLLTNLEFNGSALPGAKKEMPKFLLEAPPYQPPPIDKFVLPPPIDVPGVLSKPIQQ